MEDLSAMSSAYFLLFDIEAYTRGRTDDDRTYMRERLQVIIAELLGTIEVAADTLRAPGDLGDGVLLVLNPDVGLDNLVMKFYPQLNIVLRQNNTESEIGRQIRVRISLTRGSVSFDRLRITGEGVVAQSLNLAARLLDGQPLRELLRRRPDLAVALMVDEDIAGTIKAEHPMLHRVLRRQVVQGKDGSYVGFTYALPAPAATRPQLTSLRNEALLVEPTLSNIGTHLFVSTFDTHINQLYAGAAGSLSLTNHLATALLLTDGAIVHCVDPYRRESACTALETYREFVQDGSILFLLSSAVKDVRRDYERYVRNRANEYAGTGWGSEDLASLELPLQLTPERLDRAIALVAEAPKNVRRDFSATGSFREALERDLEPREAIITAENPLGKLLALNLTLQQLLNISELRGRRVSRIVGSKEEYKRFVEFLMPSLLSARFSRQIILSALREYFPKLSEHASIQELVEARVHVLYLNSTVKPHPFIEVTLRRDERSSYYSQHLRAHLAVVAQEASVPQFSPALVRTLLECEQWPSFVDYHLACVAEHLAHRLADRHVDIERIFRQNHRLADFSLVRAAISRYAKGIA